LNSIYRKFLGGKCPNRSRVVTNNNNSATIFAHFYVNSHTSIRDVIAIETNISIGSVHRIIKDNKYYLFKLVHHLRPTDEIRHLEFITCHCL